MKIILVALFSIVTCTNNAYAEVRILAASSMTNVIQDVSQEFEKETGIAVKPIFGSSASLARQIIQGAPADLYLSANTRWARYVIDTLSLPSGRMVNIAKNQLVLVAPIKQADDFVALDNRLWWTEKLADQHIAIGNPNSVPAGIYAKQALESLGVWKAVKRRVAQTNNVRVALALVERAEVPLSIVFATDALYSDSVTNVATFDDELHDPIVYPLVNLTQNRETLVLSKFLESDRGKAILKKYGFIVEN